MWERFIASLMENCLQETMKIEIVANGYVFNATGYTVKFDGFTVLYEEKGDDGKTEGAAPLPPVKAGDQAAAQEYSWPISTLPSPPPGTRRRP